jgi:hypothetical protein
MRQHEFEGLPRVDVAVQEQCGNARGVSLLDIGKLDLVRKFNRFDNRCHVYSAPVPPAVISNRNDL